MGCKHYANLREIYGTLLLRCLLLSSDAGGPRAADCRAAARASRRPAPPAQGLGEGAGEGLLAALADGTAASAGVDGVTAASVKALAAAALKSGPALATVGPAAAVPSYATLAGML